MAIASNGHIKACPDNSRSEILIPSNLAVAMFREPEHQFLFSLLLMRMIVPLDVQHKQAKGIRVQRELVIVIHMQRHKCTQSGVTLMNAPQLEKE